ETKIPLDRTAVTADKYGNTGAASIPIALDEAISQKRICPGLGQEMILFGAASGFSIGHVRLRM
ncbi:MAG: 3-oxoacyl-[acyl-carrier-protein] synthase III C-terminal domain-containing protein, partial [Planctomycetota bacterium]